MKYLTLLSFGVFTALFPEVASAQFVPCGGPDEPCQFCHLVIMGNRILLWLVVTLTFVAGLIFAVAGLKLVTSGGNPSQKDAAKSMFVNVIIGYLIVLAAWLIIDTIMRALLSDQIEAQIGPWNSIECEDQPDPPSEVGGAQE